MPTAAKKKTAGKKKDPNAPKRALSAYIFFCADHRAGVLEENPGISAPDVLRALGEAWRKCDDRSKYEKKAEKDKARYAREMKAYTK